MNDVVDKMKKVFERFEKCDAESAGLQSLRYNTVRNWAGRPH
jgi:hypothetical protein